MYITRMRHLLVQNDTSFCNSKICPIPCNQEITLSNHVSFDSDYIFHNQITPTPTHYVFVQHNEKNLFISLYPTPVSHIIQTLLAVTFVVDHWNYMVFYIAILVEHGNSAHWKAHNLGVCFHAKEMKVSFLQQPQPNSYWGKNQSDFLRNNVPSDLQCFPWVNCTSQLQNNKLIWLLHLR